MGAMLRACLANTPDLVIGEFSLGQPTYTTTLTIQMTLSTIPVLAKLKERLSVKLATSAVILGTTLTSPVRETFGEMDVELIRGSKRLLTATTPGAAMAVVGKGVLAEVLGESLRWDGRLITKRIMVKTWRHT